MAAQIEAGARARRRLRPYSRRDRHHQPIGSAVEVLEPRLVLAGLSPTTPMLISSQAVAAPGSHALGAAYLQVMAIDTTTLQTLGNLYREVQAVGAQFASRANLAINELNAELSQTQSPSAAVAIASLIRRDRDLLNLGGADVAREEQGLDVSRGLANQQDNTDETDIINDLSSNLAELIQQDQSTNLAISRTGQRSVNTFVQEIDKLGDQLTSTFPERTSVKN